MCRVHVAFGTGLFPHSADHHADRGSTGLRARSFDPNGFRRRSISARWCSTAPPRRPARSSSRPSERFLYLVQGNNRALRYGIGVGRDGFQWSGLLKIIRKAEWPDWTPPPEMIARQPYLPRFMAGGPGNPLGARALYLGDDGLPHPWHQPAADHRAIGLVGLLPPGQSRRRRLVRPHSGRDQGDRAPGPRNLASGVMTKFSLAGSRPPHGSDCGDGGLLSTWASPWHAAVRRRRGFGADAGRGQAARHAQLRRQRGRFRLLARTSGKAGRGFDVDFCRALAAADPRRRRESALRAAQRQ